MLTDDRGPSLDASQVLMRGFAVYWNTRSFVELAGLPLEQLLKEMARYEEITASAESSKEKMAYIVSPVTLEVKLTHNEGSAEDPATPVYVCILTDWLIGCGGQAQGGSGGCLPDVRG